MHRTRSVQFFRAASAVVVGLHNIALLQKRSRFSMGLAHISTATWRFFLLSIPGKKMLPDLGCL